MFPGNDPDVDRRNKAEYDERDAQEKKRPVEFDKEFDQNEQEARRDKKQGNQLQNMIHHILISVKKYRELMQRRVFQ